VSNVFADTFYFLALLNPEDRQHPKAVAHSQKLRSTIWTTEWVLTEVADAFAGSQMRSKVADFVEKLPQLPNTRVVEASTVTFHEGLRLYAERPDKAWSLTDCISFVVMKNNGLRDALTGDRHFTQAGFVALFAD
jgi:predicted nucleic acid-binding protein